MTRAEQLANDLHRQLELVEWERDEAVRERDEAHAVIDAVRKVRNRCYRVGYSQPCTWLDEVDGL